MSNELTLPERPNLDQLRKQARELQRSQADLSLSEAQRDLARSYGFPSWAKLKHHVEEVLGLRTYLQAFVEAALGGRLEEADGVLDAHPGLRTSSTVALMTGDAARAEGIDPEEPVGPREWVPLLYVCFSRYHQRPEARAGLMEVAQDLLRRGADPDAFYIDESIPDPPETCLYGAVGVNNNAELTALLLQYGANATDAEALYHGTEHKSPEALRLVLEAGGNPKGMNTLARMLDFDNLPGLKLVLSHYGPPDEELYRAVHHAIIRGRSPEHLQLLVAQGADVNYRRDSLTPYLLARLLNAPASAEYLASIGADTSMTPAERYVVACSEGDESVPPVTIPSNLHWLLAAAAGHNRVEVMRKLLAAGCDPSAAGGWGQTGLHQAGWNGHAEAVELLLEHGSSLAVRDPHHNGTPLNFTVAGAAWGINPQGDHLRCVRAMLEAGAAEHCSREWVLDLAKDMPEMRGELERWLGC